LIEGLPEPIVPLIEKAVSAPQIPSNTIPKQAKFDLDMLARAHVVNGLEKAINNCNKMIPNINIWTERKDVTKEYFPQKLTNTKLVIGIVTPIKNGR